jgi:LmbE family N-acetylglucosaminyl deacetylase
MLKTMRVLAISAHPDDETLGCGGTLLKHGESGDELYWLIATVCHEPQWQADTIRRKAVEVERVAEAFGMKKTFKLGFPNARLDTVAVSDLMARVADVISEARPELVYLLHGGDIHTDHAALFTATMSVLKPFYMYKRGVKRIVCYETLSSTDAAPPRWERAFVPSIYSEISRFIDRKIEIMQLYETEIHPDPMPRGESAIRALARFRGTTISAEYAEAFTLVRELM